MSSNIMYFLVGALSMFMLMLLTSDNPVTKTFKKKKKWEELVSVTQKYDFDHVFNERTNAHAVMLGIITATYDQFESGHAHFKDHLIEPGNYSVSAITTLRFVKRENDGQS